MGTTTYVATGLPVTVSPLTTVSKLITVGDNGSVRGLSIIIDVDAPNEGGGPDTSLIKAYIIHTYTNGTSTDAVLHDGEYKSLDYAAYPVSITPTETLNIFNDRASFGSWYLYLFNISASSDAVLNYYSLAITYDDDTPAGNASVSIQPAAKYGNAINFHKTHQYVFEMESSSTYAQANNYRHISFNGVLNTAVLITHSGGAASGSPYLDVYRIRSGVKTLISSTLISTATNSSRKYLDIPDEYKIVKTDDFISVEISGLNIVSPAVFVQMEFYE
jgi:hypothetical protein